MGRSSRHSKNAGVMGAEGLTYNEKRGLGYGTVKERLGKDAIGNYFDCKLSLTPVLDPVCTPSGILYSREAILTSLLQQKQANKRKYSAWVSDMKEEKQREQERRIVEEHTKLLTFDKLNHMGASKELANNISTAIQEETETVLNRKKTVAGAVNIHQNADTMKEMKAFWLPSKTPEVRQTIEKPDDETICPASGKKLRLRDLTCVAFTPVPEGEEGFAMDPITKDIFTNASTLVVLKSTGDVVLKDTYEKYIKPEGHYAGKRVAEGDVIELRKGGTGYALHDKNAVESKKFWYLGPGTGRQDLRGQSGAAQSKGGLVFRN